MGMRDWPHRHPVTVSLVAVAALVLALVMVVWNTGPADAPDAQAYFYDPGAALFFSGQADRLPPVDTPAGERVGLRAAIFACGDCPAGIDGMGRDELQGTNAFVGYFERYPDAAVRILEQIQPDTDPEEAAFLRQEARVQGVRVRAPEEDRWFARDTEAGRHIIDERVEQQCEQRPLRICRP